MKLKISSIVLLFNVLFYWGIFGTIYLYLNDDNSPKWLLVVLCIVVGIIGSAIPDSIINVGIAKLSIQFVRIGMILKFLCFVSCFSFLNIITLPTIIIIGICCAVDVWIEYCLIQQIESKNILLDTYIDVLKNSDTSQMDSVLKYLVHNLLGVILFLNIHENIIEFMVMFVCCIVLHFRVSTKCIEKMKIEKPEKIKMGVVLWLLEAVMLVLAYYKITMVVCIVHGVYYMIVCDMIMKNETSIFGKGRRKSRG